jgi:hypothetical protein
VRQGVEAVLLSLGDGSAPRSRGSLKLQLIVWGSPRSICHLDKGRDPHQNNTTISTHRVMLIDVVVSEMSRKSVLVPTINS